MLSLAVARRLGGFALEVAHDFPLDDVTALFGPSGAGKSLLLRIMAGLDGAARGRVTFGAETWQDSVNGDFVPAHRRGVGYVFQDARLFPHLTVAGNLHYAERRSRGEDGHVGLDDVVGALDLGPLLERDVDSLSGGERQRVAVGRTLLSRPRLLLMDEPLAALDLRRKAEALPYLERLPSAFGVPIIYVTHAVEEVVQLARRMVLLSEGRIVASGPVAEVLERIDLQPLTGRFEAGVLLSARVAGHDPEFALTTLEVAGQALVLPMLDLPLGSEARLRVRARDVALATRRPDAISIRNVLTGRVSEIASEAERAFAEVLVDLNGAHLRARVTRKSVAELGLAPGVPVFALVKSIAFDRRALAP